MDLTFNQEREKNGLSIDKTGKNINTLQFVEISVYVGCNKNYLDWHTCYSKMLSIVMTIEIPLRHLKNVIKDVDILFLKKY